MKKCFFSKILLISFLILFFSLSSIVIASDENANIVESYETNYTFASSDLFLFNANIEMSEIVDGNVFAYGSTVNITGEIYGDLFVFANKLNISEDAIIHGNLFAISNDITISGLISDAYAMSSSSFTLEENSIIARNLNVMSNSVSLFGKVSRDANIYTDNLSFPEDGKGIIVGNLNYTSRNTANIAEGIVGGEIRFSAIEENTTEQIISAINSIITSLLFSFVVIMLSLWISPKFKDNLYNIISKHSFKAFGIGLLVFFATIITAFILLIFTYGYASTIAIAAIGLLILLYSISNTIFSMSISKLITNKFNWNKNVSFVLVSLLFVLILDLIKYIPYVGSPITFITAMIGLGIICINAYKRKDLAESKE